MHNLSICATLGCNCHTAYGVGVSEKPI